MADRLAGVPGEIAKAAQIFGGHAGQHRNTPGQGLGDQVAKAFAHGLLLGEFVQDDQIGALIADSSRTPSGQTAAQLEGWRKAHQVMQSKLAVGDYAGAVAATIGADPSSSSSTFVALDADLSNSIDRIRADGQASVASSYNALALLAVGSGALSVGAALLIGLGLWPRLSEYQ